MSKKSFIKIGARVRYLGEGKFQYQDFPKDSWVEKNITGSVDKLYSSDTSVDEDGKEYYIPEAAAIAWDKGGHSLIHADEEGKRWERIQMSKANPSTKWHQNRINDLAAKIIENKFQVTEGQKLRMKNPNRPPRKWWDYMFAKISHDYPKKKSESMEH